MGRIVHTESKGKTRNNLRRTIAEIVRRLSQKSEIDDETKDMLAFIIYCLNEIDAGIQSSAEAWEKRDYWMKAEGLRREWGWVTQIADDLSEMLKQEQWDHLPQMMAALIPRFADVNIAKLTRNPNLWQGAYDQFKRDTTG